jgi:hypothetical protein
VALSGSSRRFRGYPIGPSLGGSVSYRSPNVPAKQLTGLGNCYANIATLKLCTVEIQRLLEAFYRSEFRIAESSWFAIDFVFYNPHARHLTSSKQVLYVALCGIKGHITKVDRKRGFRRQRKGFANGKASVWKSQYLYIYILKLALALICRRRAAIGPITVSKSRSETS